MAWVLKVARACVLQTEEILASATYQYVRCVELRAQAIEAWVAVGNGRKAPRRRRRARVAKRIAARYGDQHYACAKARHRR